MLWVWRQSEAKRFAPAETPVAAFEPLEERQLLTVLTWDPDCANNSHFGCVSGQTDNWTKTDAWVDTTTTPPTRYTWDGSRSGDSAVFRGEAGTLNVDATINAANVTFQDVSGYTLANGGYAMTLTNGVSVATGVTSATISANVALGGSVTASVADANSTLSVSGVLSGSNPLTKSGSGTLAFSGANTYSGDTTISAGTLKTAVSSAIPSGSGKGNVVVNGTLDVDCSYLNINGLSGSGTVTTNYEDGSATLYVGRNNQTSSFSGTIEDGSAMLCVYKCNTGALTLANSLVTCDSITLAAARSIWAATISRSARLHS